MLNSDVPIKSFDEDVLNRSTFAENLANVLLEYDASESFAVGINGKWGSGKTSVINMILEYVEVFANDMDEKPVILRFNPWLCSDPRQLISQFFKQLSSVIKMKKPKLENICDFIDDYADAFDLTVVIPVAGNILSAVGKILGKKAKEYKKSESSDLQKIKDDIIDTLKKENIKIIITIDDVDRLSNEEIVSVFQLIKSLADFPRTIYLLAFDREIVINALADVQKGDGAEYLEKIIQIPYELPSPNLSDIYQIFFNKLESIINIQEESWEKEYWSEMFHFGIKQYLHSIRDVVRFSNTFALKYALLNEHTHPIDLIGLTCLQVFEPQVYSRLPSQKEQLCGGVPVYSDTYTRENEKIEKAYGFIIEGVLEIKADNIKNILMRLFPRLNSIFNNTFGFRRHYNHNKALNTGSISNPDCFERYFALTLEPEAIPQQEINYFLFHASDDELVEAIAKYNVSKKATRLLEHIHAAFESKKNSAADTERAKLVMKCVLRYWHKLDSNDDSEFFAMPFSWRLLFCVESLLKVIGESESYSVMDLMFNDLNVDLSTVITLLRYFEDQHGRFVDKDSESQEKLLTLEEVLGLEKVFINRVVDELEAVILLNNDSAIHIIWFFGQLDELKAKEYTDKMIDSDLVLANLVSAAVVHGKGSDRTVFKMWNVKKENLAEYIDIDEAHKRMSDFVMRDEFAALPENKKENIAALLISMEEKSEIRSMRDGIVASDIEKRLDAIMLQKSASIEP